MHMLPHYLINDLILTVLVSKEILQKSQNSMQAKANVQSSFQNKNSAIAPEN